jgi:phosphate transport system permease protein
MRIELHRRVGAVTEAIIDAVIHLCGWSAILFVFAIFYFVLREAAPVVVEKLDLLEFFTSTTWRPDSLVRPQFGILALLAGTAAVTALAMAISVPVGIGMAGATRSWPCRTTCSR